MVGGIGGYVFLGFVVVNVFWKEGWDIYWLGIVEWMEV